MVKLLKYKYQLTCLFILLVLFFLELAFFPIITPLFLPDIFFDGGMALSCLYLMFHVEALKESLLVYRIMLLASTVMFIAHFWDFSDEFTYLMQPYEIYEDFLETGGFVLFLLGSSLWVKFHTKQCQLMSHLAETDPLTGVLNRRALTMRADSILNGSAPDNTHVSVIIFDIDHFKRVNDSYGHQFGDVVLVQIVSAVKTVLRKNDYLARLGGEEFVLVLFDVDLHGSKLVAERIRHCVETLTISHEGQDVACTVSLGLAISCEAELGIVEKLIGQADKALYEAKGQGRNCWRAASECSHARIYM
ncbi:GGDEF domain-containing protein [uncultured Photobacterium sp.]|uniref:GGDEF domain-containing protein n=1 Tax=uncultured Photobacterium sp. TaxID=173973 RepID=UPI002638E7BD|nr:GGDEF domain-containing protein [uncultured Photobacterium sp.]